MYFFVDEAGDPVFYNKYGQNIVGNEGCSKILLLGFIRTKNPKAIKQTLLNLREEILNDKYLANIPSISKSLVAFHAKNDCPEVREKVFKAILNLDFKAEFVVARKLEEIFNTRHHRKESIFYNDLFSKLFENKLHSTSKNIIYYAVRGNKDRQAPVRDAVQSAILAFEGKWKTKISSEIEIYPQSPSGEACLQVADYMNWVVQRAFLKGEDRYLKFVEDKISFLVDIYDFAKYPKNFYSKSNKFDLKKISPL